MCGLIFPRQNIASALHPFQQNRPIPLFLLIVRTVFPDLCSVAVREVKEESGIEEVKLLSDQPFSLEILSVDGHVKRGKYVTTHLHLNVTYLMEADPVQEIRCKPDENSAVGWIPVEQIAEKSTEPWFVERVYGKLCEKVKRDFCEV